MKNTKNVILGVLSCLLLAVGFAQSNEVIRKNDDFGAPKASVQGFARLPLPGDGGPPASSVARLPLPGDGGPPATSIA